jgi:hypothetical protein
MPGIRPLPTAAAAALAALALPARADGPLPEPGRAGNDEIVGNPLPQAPTAPATFDLGLRLGGGLRLGSASGLSLSDRGSAMIGGSVAMSPSPSFTVGVAYEHSTLGHEQGSGGSADVELARSIDAVWATLRMGLVHTEGFSFGVTIGPGLVWQHVDASGILLDAGGNGPTTFQCTDSASVGFGLRAGLGIEARLSDHAWFTADTTIDNLRLSSDAIGTCANGAGTVSVLGFRAGFVYRIDVSRIVR